MKPESRALIALVVLGPLLVVGAWFLSKASIFGGGVSSLPEVGHPAPNPSLAKAPSPVTAPVDSAKAPPRLLQSPALSKTQIAFVYGGELWTVPREGETPIAS